MIANPLTRLQVRLALGIERVPLVLPVVDDRGSIDLGQSVEMGDLEAGLAHRLEHGRGRRGGGGEEAHDVRQRPPLVVARVEQDRHDDRRAAHVRDLVLGDEVEDRLRAHLPQADVHACLDADRPGKAPAVAMEHRQRPEIDRVARHVGGDDVAGREQVRAAMVVDDALGIAGGARGVVERNRVPFVVRRGALIGFVALGDERLIVESAEPSARTVVFRVVIVDDQRPGLGQLQGRADHARKFAVDNERLGLAMIEHEGDRGRVEAGVERIEHGAAHRHAIVAFEHRRRVGEHDRDRVAADKAALGERGSELLRAGVELSIVAWSLQPAESENFPAASGLQARSSKLEARSSKLEARSSKLEARSSKLEARSSKLEARSFIFRRRAAVRCCVPA